MPPKHTEKNPESPERETYSRDAQISDGRGGYRRSKRGSHKKHYDRDKKYKGRSSARYGQRGKDSRDKSRISPKRQGFREERMEMREKEPELLEGLDLRDLSPRIRQDLQVLSRDNAETVGKHILMSIDLIDDAPELALEHARTAKNRAGRVGIVREANGVAAYRAGQWKEALSELRAARRMMGGPGLMALMADCERALGRPQKAIELSKSEDIRQLDRDSLIELAIVVAGARHDLNQHESALLTLSRLNPDKSATDFYGIRLAYAYADALEQLARSNEAVEWFESIAAHDFDEVTDAALRAEALR